MNLRIASFIASIGVAALLLVSPNSANAACIDGAPDGTWDYRQGEECDTGGTGGGCTSECNVEAGWVCEGENDHRPMNDGEIKSEVYNYTGSRHPEWMVDYVPNGYFVGSPGANDNDADVYGLFQEKRTTAPALAYSGLDAMAPEYQIALKNPKEGEDGFMGFALGFNEGDTANSDANYLLIDWKRGSGNGGNEGLRLSVVNGIPDADGLSSDFFKKNDGTDNPSSRVRLLAEADSNAAHTSDLDSGHYGNTSWTLNEWYLFTVDYTEDALTISVKNHTASTSDQVVFDISLADLQAQLGADFDDLFPNGTFPEGDLYYYQLENQDPYFTVVTNRGSVCGAAQCGDEIVAGDETCDGESNCHTTTCRFTVEVDSPSDGDVLFDQTPSINGKGDVGAEITVTVDGETYTATVDAQGDWSVDVTTPISVGGQTINVQQEDALGGTSDATVDIEIAAPYISIDAPADNTIYNANTYPQSGLIPVEGSTVPNATVEVFVDGVPEGTTTADINGDWSYDVISTQQDGTYEIKAVSSTQGAPDVDAQITIVVDTITEVAITTPADGANLTDAVTDIRGTGEPGATVEVEVNGETETTTVDADGDWTVSAPGGPLLNDEFTATATITDEAGNTDTHTSTFTVEVDSCTAGTDNCDANATCTPGSMGAFTCDCDSGYYGDGTACAVVPEVAIGQPNDGDWLKEENFTVQGIATPNTDLEITVDGTTYPVTSDNNGDWNVAVPALTASEYTIEATTAVNDPAAPVDTDAIDITVNDAPVINNDGASAIVTPGGSQSIGIDADAQTRGAIDWDTLTLTSDGGGSNGTCGVDNQRVTFQADANAALGTSVECKVEVCEEQPADLCVEATYSFEIQDVFNPTEDQLNTTKDTPMAFIPEDLLSNDGNVDEDEFALLNEDPDNPDTFITTEGGTIVFDQGTGEYTYTPPEDFVGDDSFSYTSCSGLPGDSTCEDVEVTITVNATPVVAEETTIWTVTGTPEVVIDVRDLYEGSSIGAIDPEDPVDEDDAATGSVSADVSAKTITLTPNDVDLATIYEFDVEISDNAGIGGTGKITVIYNDRPNVADPGVLLEPGTSATLDFDEVTRNSDTGDIDGGWDEDSLVVSADPNGPFTNTVDLGGDSACAIVDGELVYTLSEDVELGDDGPTCFVQVCEKDPGPVGVDGTDRACSSIDVTPTAGITIAIAGPQDGETLEADDTVVVTGTGEPNTEVTIIVDGEPVGTTTVDEDGNWEFPLEDPLTPGEHTIIAEGDNGSKDQVKVNVKDPDAESSIVINGPADGSTVTPDVTAHGNTSPFSPVTIYVDGEEVGTATADGKGQWTYNLKDLEVGERTITAEDRDGNTDEVTVTVKEEDVDDEDPDDDETPGDFDGADPDVALTGGRAFSCASMGSTGASTGFGFFALLAGLAWIRRRSAR